MTQPSVLGSVVIPAHNEAAVIARCLDALLDGFEPGELEVAVACNGCTDGTADIARSLGYKIDVLEIETASKPAALRVADEALTVFPRIYLDADIVLTSTAARKVLDCLRAEVAPVARPPISYDTQRSSLPVRSYCRARSLVPAVMHSVWGAGVYGLSVAGRARFGAFPDLIADDLFVDQHFRPDEIKVVDATPVVVRAPVRTRDLIRILRRAYHGNAENRLLAERASSQAETTSSTVRDLVRLAMTRHARVVDVILYVAVAAYTRFTLAVIKPRGWARDEGSRSA